jgi:hypothetical protein
LRLPHPHHARKKPGVAAVRRQAQRAVAESEPRVVRRNHDIGGIEQAQSATACATTHRCDNGRVDTRQPLDCQMIAVDHAAKLIRQLFARGSGEYREVAADRKIRTIAGDQHGADARVLGDLGCRLGEIGGHVGINRVTLLRTVEAQRGNATGEIEQHGAQGTGGLTPARGVGVLLERPDAPSVNCNHMRKVCIESGATLLATAAIAARHQQAAIGQIEKPLRFGARVEMPGDRAPGVAAHRGGTVVMTADAERHSRGGAAGEFRMQQRIQLRPVAGGERGIESPCEIGSVAVFHPVLLVLQARFTSWRAPAFLSGRVSQETAHYYLNGQPDYIKTRVEPQCNQRGLTLNLILFRF